MGKRKWMENRERSEERRTHKVYWKRLWQPEDDREIHLVVLELHDGTFWVSANSSVVPREEDRGPFTKEEAFVVADIMIDLKGAPDHWG